MKAPPRVWLPGPWPAAGGCLPLPREARNHLIRVLRLAEGAVVEIFDGEGGRAAARLGGRREGLVLDQPLPPEPAPPVAIHLWYGLPRGEKADQVVRQATELGAAGVHLLAAGRSVPRLDARRAAGRLERWQRVARSACAQCGRARLPLLEGPVSWERLPASSPSERGFVARLPRAGAPRSLAEVLGGERPRVLHLAVGPEGGFAPEEHTHLSRLGWEAVWLGPTVLRSETAAVALLAQALVLLPGVSWPSAGRGW